MRPKSGPSSLVNRQHRPESSLIKMTVIGQRLNHLLVGHHDEGGAVHQALLFVCPRLIQVKCATQQGGADEHDSAARILQNPVNDLGKTVACPRTSQPIARFSDDSIGQYYRIAPPSQITPENVGPLVKLAGGVHQGKPSVGVEENGVTGHGSLSDVRTDNDPHWWPNRKCRFRPPARPFERDRMYQSMNRCGPTP